MTADGTSVQLNSTCIRELQPGDVIEAPHYNFWHLFVVEEVIDNGYAIRTIHFGRESMQEQNDVRRDTLIPKICQNGYIMYRYSYPETDCYPAEEVVERAIGQLGKSGHSLKYNNAIQFALSCKLHDDVRKDYEKKIGRVRPCNPVTVNQLQVALGGGPVVGSIVGTVGGVVGFVGAPFAAVAGAAINRVGDNEFVGTVTDEVASLGDSALRTTARAMNSLGSTFKKFFN